MMRRYLLYKIIICIYFFPLVTKAIVPSRSVDATEDGIVVTYQFDDFIHQTDSYNKISDFLAISGFYQNEVAGEPAFPLRWDYFIVPNGARVELTILDDTFVDLPFSMPPAVPPTISNMAEMTATPQINPFSGYFPKSVLAKGDIQYYRKQGLIGVV